MKRVLTLLLLLLTLEIAAVDYLDINLFVDPEFKMEELNLVNFQLKNLVNDSIPQTTILAGDIISGTVSDSIVIEALNMFNPDLALPTGYHYTSQEINFPLMATNIISDSLKIISNKIIRSDSLSVGIFGIYSPDFSVKYKLDAKMNFQSFKLIQRYSKALAEEVDVVIMLSALGKYIDRDAVKDLPIDFVLSFDYKKGRTEKFHKKTNFYSIISTSGKYGKLRLKYENGEISHDWQQIQFRQIEK